ncbi:MAG: DUF222 domain-containing protein [Nocardioidaceae bacterium]
MTIQQLRHTGTRSPAPVSVSAPAPALAAGAESVVLGLAAAVDAVAGLGLTELADAQVELVLVEVTRVEARIAAARLAVLAESDRRDLAEQAAATGTDAWAAALTGSSRAVMAGGLWLAQRLQDDYPATRRGLTAGVINLDQATVIVRAGERLPEGLTAEQRALAEQGLVDQAATGMEPRRLRIAARRMLQVVSAQLADTHEAALLKAEERRAATETWFTLGDNGDGTWAGRFVIPELHATMLRAALEHLTSPRRLGRDRSGQPVVDHSVDTHNGLSRSEMLGAGLCELIEHLPTTGHGPAAATIVIHLDHQHLLDQLGAANLDTGSTLSIGAVRRLACNAGILPAVYGGPSLPLDLGRQRRLHTKAQRIALSAAHDTCAVTGCERPFAWCEIHHPHPWSHGGTTDLANALPLCGYHHRRAHDDNLTLRILPSGEARFHRRR